MSCIVPRTCTTVPPDDAQQKKDARSRPLADFRPSPAYVLLGDPGSGKSTSFKAECDALGDEACLVPARDFLALNPDAHPEWRGRTLFIDGLDEVRAGGGDARTPFDTLRGRLEALGRPRFRLSCREADWLGPNDRTNLARVTPDADLTVLRLDPLAEDDVERILNARSGIDDVRLFVATAEDKGVAGFLDNPQSLTMLADVVTSGGGWPEGRLQLFEQACRLALREQNEEHRAAERASGAVATPEDDLLDAAGRLCAVLLVSGAAGCATVRDREDADHPELGRCTPEYREHCRQAVSTNLFEAVAEGRFRPVHRHVAEFLAGRYLAKRIDGEGRNGRRCQQGVPARRIIALIAGHDGGVVTELRGLSAWIAAQSQSARNELLERDPIGVGLYGDIGEFSVREKHDLLAGLGRVSSRFHLAPGATAAFGSLAARAMQPAIEGILRDACREPEHQSFVGFVLKVLLHGAKLPGLAEGLLALVCDDTWSSSVNALALRAFSRHCGDGNEKTNRLKTLLANVHAGVIPDPDEELRGFLLSALFPRDVPASEVWGYLTTQDPELVGSCWRFWAHQIPDESPDEEVIELLDSLRQSLADLRPVLATRWDVRHTPMRLLARALELQGDTTDTKRLYDWLGVALVSPMRDPAVGDEASRIRSWLEGHPEIQKAVFAEGVDRCAESDEPRIDASEVWDRLYGSTLPADFGAWCLNQALGATERTARYFLERAFGAMIERSGDEGLSLDVLIERTSAHPTLSSILSDLSVCRLDDSYARRRERRADRERREDERLRRHHRWIDYVRSHEDALRSNRGAPYLLHQIAAAYSGALAEADGADPVARLGSLFRNDRRLVATALEALRGAIRRDDLPDVDEIIRLRAQDREHYLALPVRAGLAESERVASDEPLGLDDRQIRIALAFRYSGVSDDEPTWYRRLLALHTRLVAETLALWARAEIRNRRSHISGLSELAYGEEHAEVSRIVSLPLLRAFPIRCASRQLVDLRYLLWSALQYGDRDSFRSLIEQKLSRASMDVAQRAYWLLAGVIMSPDTWLGALEEFAEAGERRVRHIVEFLDYRTNVWFPIDRLKTQALRSLIRVVGRVYEPSSPSGVVTLAMEASERVNWMIRRLAESSTEEASVTLEALASDPALSQWRAELVRARDDQRVVRRDAAYRHPDVEQVCRTLDDGLPANAADLAALVTDRLGELGGRIRKGNTDDWRQCWNEDQHGRPREPKHEESCRDALLSDLRQCLPEELDAQPEGHYANDKRADIRISCRDFQIPVEIKKNSHPRLWSALQDQLIARYTRDPATDGYGIYLVLWFGEVDGHRTPPPPSGIRPDGPEALKARLEEALTPEEARKISVCVINVSAPSAKPQQAIVAAFRQVPRSR